MTFPRKYGGATATSKGDNARSAISFADGSSILIGEFEGTESFGGTNYTSAGEDDAFIAKLDPKGDIDWLTHFGGTGDEDAFAIAGAPDGSFRVIGSFENSVDFGETTHVSSGEEDIFVAKLDQSGNFVWTKHYGGLGIDGGEGDYQFDDSIIVLPGGTGDEYGS
ncbi:MAG: hypothetical protein AB8B36_10425, partial [Prochlorococcus sp.]